MDTELKKDYELSFLTKAPGDEVQIFELLKKHGADVYHEVQVNQISLAYKIEKQESALFGYCYFNTNQDEIDKIRTELQSLSSVLRFLLITPPMKSVERQPKTSQPTPDTKQEGPKETTLTNEDLEQKLVEILK